MKPKKIKAGRHAPTTANKTVTVHHDVIGVLLMVQASGFRAGFRASTAVLDCWFAPLATSTPNFHTHASFQDLAHGWRGPRGRSQRNALCCMAKRCGPGMRLIPRVPRPTLERPGLLLMATGIPAHTPTIRSKSGRVLQKRVAFDQVGGDACMAVFQPCPPTTFHT
eukprot:365975-Chlamydomonas_euryale.AAC.2